MSFKLPPGMTEQQFVGAIRQQYEKEYNEAFGVSPVEAAHMFAHFRDGYIGVLDELVEMFKIKPPAEGLPETDTSPDATFEARYVAAGHVLAAVEDAYGEALAPKPLPLCLTCEGKKWENVR
jgi:hypothetical protein